MSVPPTRFQEPVVASSDKLPVSVPVRFTVPPARWKLPRVVRVNAPPSPTMALVVVIVPELVQALALEPFWSPRLSVPPVAIIVAPAALVPTPVRLRLAAVPLIDEPGALVQV